MVENSNCWGSKLISAISVCRCIWIEASPAAKLRKSTLLLHEPPPTVPCDSKREKTVCSNDTPVGVENNRHKESFCLARAQNRSFDQGHKIGNAVFINDAVLSVRLVTLVKFNKVASFRRSVLVKVYSIRPVCGQVMVPCSVSLNAMSTKEPKQSSKKVDWEQEAWIIMV